MKRHSGKHGRYSFKGSLMKEVRSRTSNYCVSEKKSTNWVISHLLQKQLEKAQKYKYRRNIKFLSLRLTFIREHYFFAGWWYKLQYNFLRFATNWKLNLELSKKNKSCVSILSVHALPCFSSYLPKVRSKKTHKEQYKILEKVCNASSNIWSFYRNCLWLNNEWWWIPPTYWMFKGVDIQMLHNKTCPLLFVIILLIHSIQCCHNVETSPLI